MTADHDRGLRAVSRVRGIREQESLLALRRALAAQHEREERLTRLQTRLAAASALEARVLDTGSPGALVTLRTTLAHLGDSLRAAHADVATARALTGAARDRWEGDRSRLAAVAQLLEHRRAERRRAALRAEDRHTDETAAQGWLRGARGEEHR